MGGDLSEESGPVVAADPAAWVFVNGEQIIDFVNPDPTKDGWQSIDELMADVHRFIASGALHAITTR